MKNDWLCELMEAKVKDMKIGDRELFTEAIRRLKNDNDILEVRIVEAADNLATLREILDAALADNARMKQKLDSDERTLRVSYDLKDSGCGAVLRDGENEYCVSVMQLEEILEARRDGRLVILPMEEENGSNR